MKKTIASLLVALCVCLAPMGVWAAAKTVGLTVGKAQTLNVGGRMADILVADPSVVDVGALKANQLYVVGLKTGSTNVLVFDKEGKQIVNYNMNVAVDNSNLQGTLGALLPGQDIKVTTVNNDVVLTGSVDNPMTASRAKDIASRFAAKEGIVNMLTVKAEQQVTLKVKIVEASKATLKELGVEGNATLGDDAGGDFAGSNIASAVASGLTRSPLGIGSVIFDTAGLGRLELILRALEDNDLINTLAEPNLTAISGETAGFLVGGEFPIPSSRDQYGNLLIEYKKFGVSLNFKPIVLSEDRISLQLSTEVSQPTSTNSVTLQAISVPSLSVRRAETTVELNSGGSLLLAGLLQSKTIGSYSQIPGADKAPILGDLLKSQSFNRDETELLVLVTAYLVKPYADKSETARAELTPGQNATVNRALDNDLQAKLRRTYGTRYDRALTAAGQGSGGAAYALD